LISSKLEIGEIAGKFFGLIFSIVNAAHREISLSRTKNVHYVGIVSLRGIKEERSERRFFW